MHLTNEGKSFMIKKTRKGLFSILFLLIGFLSQAQVDSSAALADSILQSQQNVGQSLLKESDSFSQDSSEIEEWFGVVKIKDSADWYTTEFRKSYFALQAQ